MPSKPPSSLTAFNLKRHTVTLFCLLLILQLLYIAVKAYQEAKKDTSNDQLHREHFRGLAIALGLFELIPLCGLLGTLGRFRLATIIFLFSLLFIELPVFGFFLFMGLVMGGLKGVLTTKIGWHLLFGAVGGVVALVVGILFLLDLIRNDRRKRQMNVDELEWR
ncbi:hypothetical protein TYRP_006413 [Tyrophagus putrescentiae]|nr:hypothetical protein TYRP_006413 [Tyrophagus putrescentiae]